MTSEFLHPPHFTEPDKWESSHEGFVRREFKLDVAAVVSVYRTIASDGYWPHRSELSNSTLVANFPSARWASRVPNVNFDSSGGLQSFFGLTRVRTSTAVGGPRDIAYAINAFHAYVYSTLVKVRIFVGFSTSPSVGLTNDDTWVTTARGGHFVEDIPDGYSVRCQYDPTDPAKAAFYRDHIDASVFAPHRRPEKASNRFHRPTYAFDFYRLRAEPYGWACPPLFIYTQAKLASRAWGLVK